MIALALALLAAVGFGLANLLVDTTIGTSRVFHQVAMVIAAGILLGVSFADLIPEAFEHAGATTIALAIAAGFLALYLVETLTGGHTHHHEPHLEHMDGGGHPHGHAHTHAPAHAHAHQPALDDEDACVPRHAVLPFLLGLGLHNLVDGLVIGTSHEVSDSAAGGVALGIVIHQLPVGLSFAAVLLASGVTRARMRRDAMLIATMIPLGALVIIAVPDLSGTMLGVLIGAAAGALVYIATGHLLPEAHSEHRRPGLAAAFTLSLVATVLFVGAMHESSADEHAAAAEQDAHAS